MPIRPIVKFGDPVLHAPAAPVDRIDDGIRSLLDDMIATTGTAFLGLTIGCARCHEHKYDPIPQRDFYRLQAFFNAIQVDNVDVPFRDPEFAATATKPQFRDGTRLPES